MSELPEVIYKPDHVVIKLKSPLNVLDKKNEVIIKYMTARHYRNIKSDQNTKAEHFELLEALCDLSSKEIDELSIDDLGACLGVVANFLYRLQGKSMKYMQESFQSYLGLLQGNSIP
jgi:hypothetical protein